MNAKSSTPGYLGDHAWIIGEVVAVHVAQNAFKENGNLDLNIVRPALYLGGDTYCLQTRQRSVQRQ